VDVLLKIGVNYKIVIRKSSMNDLEDVNALSKEISDYILDNHIDIANKFYNSYFIDSYNNIVNSCSKIEFFEDKKKALSKEYNIENVLYE
jgi:hypothetical protein